LLLLGSLEYAAAYATLQEKQKRNEVNIHSVEHGTRFQARSEPVTSTAAHDG
jgi:hypothetical protein